jgi:hypothetical protein
MGVAADKDYQTMMKTMLPAAKSLLLSQRLQTEHCLRLSWQSMPDAIVMT